MALLSCQAVPANDPDTADASAPVDLESCHDAVVVASIVKQTPSIAPECDCIIMRWPWFLQLDVARVVEGQAKRGHQTVLSVQHTYFVDRGTTKLRLRRNTSGGFNFLGFWGDEGALCPAGTPAASPFISPGPGETLKDLETAGAKYYGSED